MILSFGSKETEDIWNGIRAKKLPIEMQQIARRKLRMLNNALDIADLRIPPANRLEKLSGNLKIFIASASTSNGASYFSGTAATQAR